MRIAISGTHCSGKSTLIDAFLASHPEFEHEPEPYRVLEEDYGEVFNAEPDADDFYRQLEFNLSRLREYPADQDVIYERCPVDFLAYLMSLSELRRDRSGSRLAQHALNSVRHALQLLDVIVFLPVTEKDGIVAPEAEDLELRQAVDDQLRSMIADDEFELFAEGRPVIVEASGATAQRLEILERAINLPIKA